MSPRRASEIGNSSKEREKAILAEKIVVNITRREKEITINPIMMTDLRHLSLILSIGKDLKKTANIEKTRNNPGEGIVDKPRERSVPVRDIGGT